MNLFPMTLSNKSLFDEYLALEKHRLSVYSFANLYLWKELYEIFWAMVEENLCIFFHDKTGFFLYLPPLGKRQRKETIQKIFFWMKEKNQKYPGVTRIENIEKESISFYRNLGYECVEKRGDYLCCASKMSSLSGHGLKSKRGAYNHFVKHYSEFFYRPYKEEDREGCLSLQEDWIKNRQTKNSGDTFYQDMLWDSRQNLQFLLSQISFLPIEGRVVEIEKKIQAFTFGYALNQEVFCVLYEITNLTKKGLAQYIFREFCAEMKSYSYINIMDDSYLPNLEKVKLSYRPIEYLPAYIVTHLAHEEHE